MNFSFFFAKRYFRSGAGSHLVNRIGIISLLSIAVSTMSLLLVLSAFNGLEDLLKSLFNSFDPDIKVLLKQGKRFAVDPAWMRQVQAERGVAKVVEVVEDSAMLRYQGKQMIVRVKGVSDSFYVQSRLAPFVQHGRFQSKLDGEPAATLGIGLKYALGIRTHGILQPLQLLYPNSTRGSSLMPSQLYSSRYIRPGAIFSVERRFDDHYIIVPIDFAAALMHMGDKRTALEIQVKPEYSTPAVQKRLKACIPEAFAVLNSQEQQGSLMRAIYIERLFVSWTLVFIVLVASFNLFFVLSMLVMEKQRDVAILYTLGATPADIRTIFLLEGLLVAIVGTAIGMLAAWVLSWLQQQFGFITFGTETSLVDAYPIRRQASDFVYTAVGVLCMTVVTAYRPAQIAARTQVSQHL